MKRSLSLFIIALCSTLVNAQEAHKFKVSLDLGPVILNESGAFVAIEPKFNLSEVSSLGAKFSFAFVSKDLVVTDPNTYAVESGVFLGGNNTSSIALTYDRYFGKPNDPFQPYAGIGVARYNLGDDYDVYEIQNAEGDYGPESLARGLEFKKQVGILLRGGFELGKFRFGVDFNFVPKAELKLPSGATVAELRERFFLFTLGTTLGGGKWKNRAGS